METRNKISTGLFRIAVISALIFSAGWQLYACDHTNQISIRVEKSLIPLAEGWINDFVKSNPEFKIDLVDQNSSDTQELRIFERNAAGQDSNENEVAYLVGQQAILPVMNEQNPYFSRELKRGIRLDQLKEIFFNEESEWLFDEGKRKNPEYEIYSPVPNSPSAEAFANYFNKSASDLKGIFVSGDDSHILSAIRHDPAGITYSRLLLIFDPETREPVSGIKVLPFDLNNNGRLDKNELIYNNLDQVIQFAGNTRKPLLPAIQIILATHKENMNHPGIHHFINWIVGDGQKINAQLGYFHHGLSGQEILTQK